jgi:hypothetical protein
MRKKAWLFLAWQRLLIAGTLFAVPIVYIPQRVQALGAGDIVASINTQRTNSGLTPLSYSGQLSSSASAKARHMLALGYWGHVGPDGATMTTFAVQAGYSFTALGENLARDTGSAAGTVSLWMSSAPHRANILGGQYRDVGVGVASGTLGGVPTVLVVAHFGASASAPTPVPVPKPVTAAPVARQTAGTAQKVAPNQPEPVKPSKPAEPSAATVKTAAKPTFNELLKDLEQFAVSPVMELLEG